MRIYYAPEMFINGMKKLSKKKREIKKSALKKEADERDQTELEKGFDFGGLPDRNLKKNLGC